MQPVIICTYNNEIDPLFVSAVINTTPMNVERLQGSNVVGKETHSFIAIPVSKRLMCTCMLTIAQVKIRTTPCYNEV